MCRNVMIGRVAVGVLLVHSVACGGEATPPFTTDLTYEPLAKAGGLSETNDLFITGSPVPWLVDSTVVAYTDQAVGGHLAVVDILEGTGWSIRHQRGADGPGELNGRVPMLSPSGDTVKTLRGDGRVAARLKDGTLLYDSLIRRTIRPGVMAVTLGFAGNRQVSEYHEGADPIHLGILLEPFSGDPLMIPLDTVRAHADEGFTSPFIVRARGNVVVYLRGQTVTTMDVRGQEIAREQIPWRAANAIVDGSGRVWVQVFGGDRGGYNLMLFTRDLHLVGQAVIPGFRDAFGDYVLSVQRDSLDVQTMIPFKTETVSVSDVPARASGASWTSLSRST